MPLTYRGPGAWGAGKGSALSAAEFDGNTWELVQLIAAAAGTQGASVSNIVKSGNQLTFYLDNGTEFGPFTLPVATFRWRGGFVGGTTYAGLDLIPVEGVGVVIVLRDHVADPTFDIAAEITDGPLYQLIFGALRLDDLADVEIATAGPADGDVLVFDAAAGLWMPGVIPGAPVASEAGAAFTPALDAAGYWLRMTNGAGCVVTLPDDGEVPFPVRTELHFEQVGGPLLFEAATGAVVTPMAGREAATDTDGAVVTAKKVAADTWRLFGALAEATA